MNGSMRRGGKFLNHPLYKNHSRNLREELVGSRRVRETLQNFLSAVFSFIDRVLSALPTPWPLFNGSSPMVLFDIAQYACLKGS